MVQCTVIISWYLLCLYCASGCTYQHGRVQTWYSRVALSLYTIPLIDSRLHLLKNECTNKGRVEDY